MLYGIGEFTLALDESVHLVVVHRLAELEADLLVLLEHIHYLLHAFAHHFDNCLGIIEMRLLFEVADAVAGGEDHLAVGGGFQPCDDLHQRGLSGSVQTDDADLRAVEE